MYPTALLMNACYGQERATSRDSYREEVAALQEKAKSAISRIREQSEDRHVRADPRIYVSGHLCVRACLMGQIGPTKRREPLTFADSLGSQHLRHAGNCRKLLIFAEATGNRRLG